MRQEFDELLRSLLGLPMLWVVGGGEARFHVIHAELARSGSGYRRKSSKPVWLDKDIDRWLADGSIPSAAMDRLAWGRSLMLDRDAESGGHPVQEGLSTTYCGHT